MRNTNKKGFTIVELVIVVAVIAILAAVLIPTFSGIIRKANESKDTQLVKHLNTAIAADVNGDKTMSAAIAAAAEFGFDLSKIDAKVEGNEILWDSVANVFCYLNNGKVEYISEVANKGTGAQLWIIDTDGDDKTHETYSSYVANVEADKTVVANHSIDTTACPGVSVEYKGANNVNIYTNGGVLTVDAPSATVNHYGDAAEVYVNAVSANTFNLYAKVGYLEVAAGQHVVLKSGSKANAIFADTTSNVEVKNGQPESIVVTGGDKESVKLGATLFAGGTGTEANPYLIENAEQFTNIGASTSTKVYKLTNNIDMSSISIDGSAYISNVSENVVIDLNEKTISNVAAYLFTKISNLSIYNGTIGFNGNAGVVNSATDGVAVNLSFSDLSLTGNIETTSAHYGSLLCYAFLRNEHDTVVTAENVVFSASINNTSTDGYSGSLIGYLGGSKTTLNLKNCAMNGSIQSVRAGGFAGYSTSATLNATEVIVNGSIIGSQYVGAFNAKAAYDEYISVSESAVIGKINVSTTLVDGAATANGGEFKINHDPNSTITKYVVSLEYWVTRNSDGTGGYPRSILINIPVTEIGDGSTGLYKLNFVQVDSPLNREADYTINGAKIWKEADAYKIYDPDYTMYSTEFTFKVMGYNASNDLVTYQNYKYNTNK